MSKPHITCVIPARYASERFPGKILTPLAGKPLIQHVWEAASRVSIFHTVIIALDHPDTIETVKSFGGKYIITDPNCPTGTDRLIESYITGEVPGDIWVNWQVDAPFIQEKTICDLLPESTRINRPEKTPHVWTLRRPIYTAEEFLNPSLVKVVTDKNNNALYFSRAPIPYHAVHGSRENQLFGYKHVGLYAYNRAALDAINTMEQTELECSESLEQLRFLENNITISAFPTEGILLDINTPTDLRDAEKLLNQSSQPAE